MKPPRCSNGRAGYAGRGAMLVGGVWSVEGGKTKSDSFSPTGAAAYCTSFRTVTTRDAAIAEASESSRVRRFVLNALILWPWWGDVDTDQVTVSLGVCTTVKGASSGTARP